MQAHLSNSQSQKLQGTNLSRVQILDCTIRDGGYLNNWEFSDRLVRELYRSSSKAGVDFIELGYWGSKEKSSSGKWSCVGEEDIAKAVKDISGAKVAVMINFGNHEKVSLLPKSKSAVDLIRVACSKGKVDGALEYCKRLKDYGYLISLNLMGYSKYSDSEREEVTCDISSSSVIDYVYVADSYGSFFPQQIESYFKPLKALKNVLIGFHPHNNIQMALANTLEAMRVGVQIVDASVFGMGRGAGNLTLESLVAYLQQSYPDRYNVLPLLDLIDSYIMEIHQKDPWGYKLPYMLSGICDLHPNYSTALIKRREYSIEQVWHILKKLQSRKETRFSEEALNEIYSENWFVSPSSRDKIQGELNAEEKSAMKQPVPYQNWHKGRDFLILANGPSLLTYKDSIVRLIDQYKPVVLGANYLGNLFIPDYHVFINERRFKSYVETVHGSSKLLLGSNLPQDVIQDYLRRPFETLHFIDRADVGFTISESGVIGANCFTVSVLMIALAFVMGAQRIFVAGMDGYTRFLEANVPSMFYGEPNEPKDSKVIVEREQACYKFLRSIDSFFHEHDKEGFHIVTPTVYERFYKGIDNYLDRTAGVIAR